MASLPPSTILPPPTTFTPLLLDFNELHLASYLVSVTLTSRGRGSKAKNVTNPVTSRFRLCSKGIILCPVSSSSSGSESTLSYNNNNNSVGGGGGGGGGNGLLPIPSNCYENTSNNQQSKPTLHPSDMLKFPFTSLRTAPIVTTTTTSTSDKETNTNNKGLSRIIIRAPKKIVVLHSSNHGSLSPPRPHTNLLCDVAGDGAGNDNDDVYEMTFLHTLLNNTFEATLRKLWSYPNVKPLRSPVSGDSVEGSGVNSPEDAIKDIVDRSLDCQVFNLECLVDGRENVILGFVDDDDDDDRDDSSNGIYEDEWEDVKRPPTTANNTNTNTKVLSASSSSTSLSRSNSNPSYSSSPSTHNNNNNNNNNNNKRLGIKSSTLTPLLQTPGQLLLTDKRLYFQAWDGIDFNTTFPDASDGASGGAARGNYVSYNRAKDTMNESTSAPVTYSIPVESIFKYALRTSKALTMTSVEIYYVCSGDLPYLPETVEEAWRVGRDEYFDDGGDDAYEKGGDERGTEELIHPFLMPPIVQTKRSSSNSSNNSGSSNTTASQQTQQTQHDSIHLTFPTSKDLSKFISTLLNHTPHTRAYPCIPNESDPKNVAKYYKLYLGGRISNFSYLLFLNSAAGRSFKDLGRYPVFPWLVNDYTSSKLEIKKDGVLRDLSRPIGALDSGRLSGFKARMASMSDSHPTDTDTDSETRIQPFLYGTHYSTSAYVLYYLVRLLPSHVICIQSGTYDHPDRTFQNVQSTWNGCLIGGTDVKELIPEFYDDLTENVDELCDGQNQRQKRISGSAGASCSCNGSFLNNSFNLPLGVTHENQMVNDVVLPKWAKGSRDFIRKNRKTLESKHVSSKLNEWIDLIFGYKSRGRHAVECDNLFYPSAYYTASTSTLMDDEEEEDSLGKDKDGGGRRRRRMAVLEVGEFGVVPDLLFVGRHGLKGVGMGGFERGIVRGYVEEMEVEGLRGGLSLSLNGIERDGRNGTITHTHTRTRDSALPFSPPKPQLQSKTTASTSTSIAQKRQPSISMIHNSSSSSASAKPASVSPSPVLSTHTVRGALAVRDKLKPQNANINTNTNKPWFTPSSSSPSSSSAIAKYKLTKINTTIAHNPSSSSSSSSKQPITSLHILPTDVLLTSSLDGILRIEGLDINLNNTNDNNNNGNNNNNNLDLMNVSMSLNVTNCIYLKDLGMPITSVTASPCGRIVFTGGCDDKLTGFTLNKSYMSGKLCFHCKSKSNESNESSSSSSCVIHQPHTDSISKLTLFKIKDDEYRVVSGAYDATVKIWEVHYSSDDDDDDDETGDGDGGSGSSSSSELMINPDPILELYDLDCGVSALLSIPLSKNNNNNNTTGEYCILSGSEDGQVLIYIIKNNEQTAEILNVSSIEGHGKVSVIALVSEHEHDHEYEHGHGHERLLDGGKVVERRFVVGRNDGCLQLCALTSNTGNSNNSGNGKHIITLLHEERLNSSIRSFAIDADTSISGISGGNNDERDVGLIGLGDGRVKVVEINADGRFNVVDMDVETDADADAGVEMMMLGGISSLSVKVKEVEGSGDGRRCVVVGVGYDGESKNDGGDSSDGRRWRLFRLTRDEEEGK